MAKKRGEWVTVPEAALMLGCADSCVRAYIREGKLPATQVRRSVWVPGPPGGKGYKKTRTMLCVKRSDITAREDYRHADELPLTSEDVSEQLGCSMCQASDLMRDGKIKAKKVHRHWRTTQTAVDAYRRARLHRRPGLDQRPISINESDHHAACARCICAICARQEACPVYSGNGKPFNRCNDPAFCAKENGGARIDTEKTPLELEPHLTYERGLGWKRHDDKMAGDAEATCRHFVRDCGYMERSTSVWSVMLQRAGLKA